jgi:hypothetical protein
MSSSPLQTTFTVLAESRNEAAVGTLVAGLENPDETIFSGVLQALVARRSKSGHLEVVRRWHELSESDRKIVYEGRARLSSALRDAVLSDDGQLFTNTCDIVELFGEFDLTPTLVTLAEDQKNPHALGATKLVVRLIDRLAEMIHGPRDYNDRRDPELMRRFVMESLERSVERFRTHERSELIEAFVILGGVDNSLLNSIVDDPRHACYITVLHTLNTSTNSGVLDYLVDSLGRERCPQSILSLVGKRSDPSFVARLLKLGDETLPPKTLRNLGKLRALAWLEPEATAIDGFDEAQQVCSVRLARYAGVKQDEFLDFAEQVFLKGLPDARLVACEVMTGIQGDRANRLVLKAIKDEEPRVQAAAASQLRDRHIPGTTPLLIELLDSPHEVVRAATREALSEFSFENFLVGYEGLSDDARRKTGELVFKVDQQAITLLAEELVSKSRTSRLRGVEIAEALGLVPQIEERLITLLSDEDHLVRAAAADALQFAPTSEVKQALEYAASDKSSLVQKAAKESLAVLGNLGGGPTLGVSLPEGVR